jgi:ParB/RepB/Spo0J family partition protein
MQQHKYGYAFDELPVEKIERDVNQPRRDFGTEGDTNRLLLSIKRYGIENVIAVSEYEPGRYIIIDGHRRYICAQKLGFLKVPCRIYPKLSNAELEAIRYEVQNNRRPWRPMERSEALERIKTENSFTSNRQLAEHLGITEAVVANSLQLRRQKMDYIELMERYNLTESYRIEFVRLKPKLRKIRNYEVDEMIINLFDRIQHKVIKNSKEFRKLGRIFLRATANEEELARYLDDPDMTVYELEQRTLQSGFSLHIEELLNAITHKRSKGIAFSLQEKAFLEQLKQLLNQTI